MGSSPIVSWCFFQHSERNENWKDLNSTESRKYPDSILVFYPCKATISTRLSGFDAEPWTWHHHDKDQRGSSRMASRQRPTNKQDLVTTWITPSKPQTFFLGGQCAGPRGPTDNCLQEGKAMGTHDTSWYHAGEMGLQKDVSFVKSSFSRLAFKQKLYKRGMILVITIGMKHVWNNCRHMKTNENMCSRIAMRPLMRSTSSLGTKSYSFVSPIEGRCSLTVTLKHRGNKLHVTDSFTFTSFTSWHVQCSLNTLHYRRLQHLCSPAMSQGACYRMSCGAFVKNWRILQLLHPWRIAFYRIWNQIQTSWIQNGLPFVLALLFLNRRPAGLVVSKCFMKDKNSSKT